MLGLPFNQSGGIALTTAVALAMYMLHPPTVDIHAAPTVAALPHLLQCRYCILCCR